MCQNQNKLDLIFYYCIFFNCFCLHTKIIFSNKTFTKETGVKTLKKILNCKNDILVNYCDYFTTKCKTFAFSLFTKQGLHN